MTPILVASSILAADLGRLYEEIRGTARDREAAQRTLVAHRNDDQRRPATDEGE
jgi:hypothetical protein